MKDIRLRKRDLEVLYHISTQNFATNSEICTLFWESKKSLRSHYRRLSRFKEHGLIEPLKALQSSELGYTITLKGQNLLRDYGYKVNPCTVKKDIYVGTYRHDLLLNRLKRILLESSIIKDFIPEYQIAYGMLKNSKGKEKYAKKDKIPDGLFTLLVQGKPQKVALELELSLKSKRRYELIFSKHLLSRNWSTVFYIVKDETMREKLMDYVKEIKRKSFLLRREKRLSSIYFSLVDEVLEKRLHALFMNQRIRFSLKDLEKKAC